MVSVKLPSFSLIDSSFLHFRVIRRRREAGDPLPITIGSPGHDPGGSLPPVTVQTKTGQTLPSVWMALFGAFGLNFFVSGFLKLVADLLPYINPQVLG